MIQLLLLLFGGLLVGLGFYLGHRRSTKTLGESGLPTTGGTGPRIVRQPMDVHVRQGETTTLEVQASGNEPISFQWFRGDQPVQGATESYLEVSAPDALRLQVKNPWGQTFSRVCQVSLLVPPVIITDPKAISVLAGESESLSVEISSTTPVTYQWYRNGTPIPGAVGQTLHLSEIPEGDHNAEYQVLVSNAAGAIHSKPARVAVRVNRLILGDPARPEIELTRWGGMPVRTRDIAMSSSLKSQMGMMVQPGMSLIHEAEVARGAFKVVFSPEVTRGLREGSYTLMQGSRGNYASAVNSGSKIVGNGQLVANNAARAAAVATAAFQILAVVTAQKFLADIDKKLAKIDRGVKEIQNWLEEDAKATLYAGHNYLSGITQTIQEQKLSQPEVTAFLTQLEQIDQGSQRVALLMLTKLERIKGDLPEFKRSTFAGGAGKNAELLKQKMDEWGYFAHGLMGALRLRGAAAQLRCSLPVNMGPTDHRFNSLQDCIGEFQSAQDSFAKAIRNRAERLKSIFSEEEALTYRNKFLNQVDQFEIEFIDLRQEMRGTLQTLQIGLQEMNALDQRGMTMLVTLDANGEVAKLEQVEEGDA